METNICNTVTLKGEEYVVSLQVADGVLSIDVELSSSTEQWQGMFERNYIEELTRKTGNFKQFNVFCNMLETALMHTSDCVSLDLLTLSDLEALRQKRSTDLRFQATAMRVLTPQNGATQNGVSQSSASQKRYLILTYTAQFDRIHYPLPLSYVGRPNPRRMQQEIRSLKSELRKVQENAHGKASIFKDSKENRNFAAGTDNAQKEARAAHFELDRLRDEKTALEREINELRLRKLHSEFSVTEPEKDVGIANSSPSATHRDGESPRIGAQGQKQRNAIEFTRMLVAKNEELRREIRLLKGVVQNVEAERIREKSEFQKALAKRQREFRELTEQLDGLRTSERSLRIKLKQTANELEAFKRLYRSGPSRSMQHSASIPFSDRDSSQERSSFHRSNLVTGAPRSRSASADRSVSKPPRRPESAREARKQDRVERAMFESLPKSAREFFDAPSSALRYGPPAATKQRSRSNSASSTTQRGVIPQPKRAASPSLVGMRNGSQSLPGSRRSTPRSSVEREPVPVLKVVRSRSNSRDRERDTRLATPNSLKKESIGTYRSAESNQRKVKTTDSKRKARPVADEELKLNLCKELEADRDLEEIDARLERIQNMMKHYRVPVR